MARTKPDTKSVVRQHNSERYHPDLQDKCLKFFLLWIVPAGYALVSIAGYANSLGLWGYVYPDLARRAIVAGFATGTLGLTIYWLKEVTFAKKDTRKRHHGPN